MNNWLYAFNKNQPQENYVCCNFFKVKFYNLNNFVSESNTTESKNNKN